MEKLNPVERAAYVLREAFDYPYKRVADILETSDANARQLVSRARKHLGAERKERVSPAAHRRLLEGFLSAARTGDLSTLEDLLTSDVVSYSDGGGIRGASRIPVVGRDHVSRYLTAFAPRFWPDAEIRFVQANGRDAVLVSRDDAPVALMCLDASEAGIDRIMWVMNPAKLTPTCCPWGLTARLLCGRAVGPGPARRCHEQLLHPVVGGDHPERWEQSWLPPNNVFPRRYW